MVTVGDILTFNHHVTAVIARSLYVLKTINVHGLVKPPDIVRRKALISAAELFFTEVLISYTAQQLPVKCISQVRPYGLLDHPAQHSPHSSPNFTGGSKSVKFGLNFDTVGMGVVIKAEKDWRGVGWPQVAMHHNCHISSW